MEFELDGRRHRVDVRRDGALWRVTVDGREVWVDARRTDGRWSLLLDAGGRGGGGAAGPAGRPVPPVLASHEVAVEGRGQGDLLVHVDGRTVELSLPGMARRTDGGRGGAHARTAGAGDEQVVAPMPGRIVKVLVTPGEVVRARQPLLVIEAMKMENELRAGRPGIVSEVRVAEGGLVEAKAVLVVLREPAGAARESGQG